MYQTVLDSCAVDRSGKSQAYQIRTIMRLDVITKRLLGTGTKQQRSHEHSFYFYFLYRYGSAFFCTVFTAIEAVCQL